ncbi:polysaccharide deacetylase family protein [Kiloniella laminariae]|uniref:Polysaccharide deacetylase family protein n=1 Tax=Kiloniella laminariae TaxID=454162 RepID=A0ABT4LIG4_9PROT|nr:polysaccharide deacetylase family protein [Kiloniella laminariae]MCZ4280894.1 polysaccharide deacetylase family protein [Kiloniella laminariae]
MSLVLNNCHILLYHGTFERVPEGMEKGLHNVSPLVFQAQVRWLRENFDLVTVDEISSGSDLAGKAAITFDDAYSSIFSNALPWLIDEGIPSCVYVNSALIEGRGFWRDKIRYLINCGLVADFLDFCQSEPEIAAILPEQFYRASKKPELNSSLVDLALNRFFAARPSTKAFNLLLKAIASRKELLDHPLVSYGNHSHSHYVLSSLSEGQQHDEILLCRDWLEVSGLNLSESFAAPFGGGRDINSSTERIVREQGYRSLLMSRKAVNRGMVPSREANGLRILERYMAPDSLGELQGLVREMDGPTGSGAW